jgi:hypothetical protein
MKKARRVAGPWIRKIYDDRPVRGAQRTAGDLDTVDETRPAGAGD